MRQPALRSVKTRRHWLVVPALALALGLGGLLGGCQSVQTGSHFDEGFGFTALKRFHWLSDEAVVIPPDADPGNSPLLHRYIKEAIETTLTNNGFEQAASRDDADFLVAYQIGSRDRLSGGSQAEGYRRPQWDSAQDVEFVTVETAEPSVYRESTLSIDLFDARTAAPIWHGWATKVITDEDRAAPRAPVQDAIGRILLAFPPG